MNPFSRAYGFYFISYILIVYLIYLVNHRHTPEKKFIDFIFPEEIYETKTFLKHAMYFFLVFYVLAIFNTVANKIGVLSNTQPNYFELETVFNSLIFIVVFDLILYVSHILQHKINFLWKFHKFHHDHGDLHIFIAFKHHPFELMIMFIIIVSLNQSLGQALDLSVQNNMFLVSFYMLGYHLRHSHIPFEYPKALNLFLISPSDHQRHHSFEQKHFNTNYGFIFCVWDRLFKTYKK